jgi:hypothetical protein
MRRRELPATMIAAYPLLLASDGEGALEIASL